MLQGTVEPTCTYNFFYFFIGDLPHTQEYYTDTCTMAATIMVEEKQEARYSTPDLNTPIKAPGLFALCKHDNNNPLGHESS